MLFKRRFATTVKNVVEFAMKIDGHSDQSKSDGHIRFVCCDRTHQASTHADYTSSPKRW